MATSDLDLVNLAIGRAGGEEIEGFDDDTPVSSWATTAWPDKKAWLLSKYRWVFAKAVAPLQQIALPADAVLPYAFQRPADLVGAIHGAWDALDEQSRRPVALDQLADYIAAGVPAVVVEYTKDVDAARWPAWFRQLAIVAFAADVSRRLLRRVQADELEAQAFGPPEMLGEGGLYLKAMQEDSRNAPARRLEYCAGGPLVDARWGIGVGYGQPVAVGFPNNGFPFQIVVEDTD